MGVMDAIGRALALAGSMTWEILWALILGFALSAVVQAVVRKSAIVDLEFAARLERPVSLAEIKQTKQFDDWALVRQGRLSTMAAPEKFAAWMRKRFPKAKI